MSEDDRSPAPPPASIPPNAPRTVVGVEGSPVVHGEVRLADGTVLKIMLIVSSVNRIEGLTDMAGRPAYEVQSQIMIGVNEIGGGK